MQEKNEIRTPFRDSVQSTRNAENVDDITDYDDGKLRFRHSKL